jgi:hypothetical protein
MIAAVGDYWSYTSIVRGEMKPSECELEDWEPDMNRLVFRAEPWSDPVCYGSSEAVSDEKVIVDFICTNFYPSV